MVLVGNARHVRMRYHGLDAVTVVLVGMGLYISRACSSVLLILRLRCLCSAIYCCACLLCAVCRRSDRG